MLMKLLIVFCLLVYTNGQVDRDWSFRKMCSFWSGDSSYRPRVGGSNAMKGDTCDFQFPMSTDTPESAKKYCEDNVPYHINSARHGKITVCSAEAAFVCKDNWVQFFGRCYKITRKMMRREEAVDHCKKEEVASNIAFLHREPLSFRIKDYFTRVSRVWIDASEAITQELIHNESNGHLLLAIDGFKYDLPNIALVRVDSTETAMVLCEYTPPMNLAESHYLLKKYGEIYYPTVFTSDKAYVRSTSSLQRNDENRMADNNYCSKLLKPFLGDVKAQSAIPTEELIDLITKERGATIIRTSVYSGDAKKNSRISSDCTPSKSRNFGIDYAGSNGKPFFKTLKDEPIWRGGEPKETCDGATWSTGIVMSRNNDQGLEAMSDARYAPIYCQTNFEIMEYGDCPSGFTMFYRNERGQKWCHMFVTDLLQYSDAEQKCQSMGAHISGFTNQEELDLLDKMIEDSGVVFDMGRGKWNGAWMGARRRDECIKLGNAGQIGGFHPDKNHACSRLRVIEWVNGVADNPPDFLTRWMAGYEPNYAGHDEKCIELLKGTQSNIAWSHAIDGGTKKLNDIACSKVNYFFCGKEAPIVRKN